MNKLTGTIPKEMSNLTKLTAMQLYGNYLNGTIPKELSKITTLSVV
jgi:hypothetical protein